MFWFTKFFTNRFCPVQLEEIPQIEVDKDLLSLYAPSKTALFDSGAQALPSVSVDLPSEVKMALEPVFSSLSGLYSNTGLLFCCLMMTAFIVGLFIFNLKTTSLDVLDVPATPSIVNSSISDLEQSEVTVMESNGDQKGTVKFGSPQLPSPDKNDVDRIDAAYTWTLEYYISNQNETKRALNWIVFMSLISWTQETFRYHFQLDLIVMLLATLFYLCLFNSACNSIALQLESLDDKKKEEASRNSRMATVLESLKWRCSERQVRKLSKELEEARLLNEDLLQKLGQSGKDHKMRLADVQLSNENTIQELEQSREDCKKLQEKYKSLKQSFKESNVENGTLKQELDLANQSVKGLENENESLREILELQHSNLRQLRASNSSLREASVRLEGAMDSLRDTNADLQVQMGDLKDQVEVATAQLISSQSDLIFSQKQNSQLTIAILDQAAEIDQLYLLPLRSTQKDNKSDYSSNSDSDSDSDSDEDDCLENRLWDEVHSLRRQMECERRQSVYEKDALKTELRKAKGEVEEEVEERKRVVRKKDNEVRDLKKEKAVVEKQMEKQKAMNEKLKLQIKRSKESPEDIQANRSMGNSNIRLNRVRSSSSSFNSSPASSSSSMTLFDSSPVSSRQSIKTNSSLSNIIPKFRSSVKKAFNRPKDSSTLSESYRVKPASPASSNRIWMSTPIKLIPGRSVDTDSVLRASRSKYASDSEEEEEEVVEKRERNRSRLEDTETLFPDISDDESQLLDMDLTCLDSPSLGD